MVTPRLTTVRIPAAAAGTAAMRMLIQHLQGDDGHARRTELLGELIVRASTGPPPGA
jgi:DNA-binding LacI/PurR family transcriptional regulator